MKIFQPESSSLVSLTNYMLFVPSISVGNVGQLTIDLLISSLDMQKAGIVYHPAIIGYIGPDPFDTNSETVCTACDLYYSQKHHIAALQIRSGFEKMLIRDFFVDFGQFVNDMQFRTVAILSSCYAYEKTDIASTNFLFFSNQTHNDNLMDSLNVSKIQPFDKRPGAGYAYELYEVLEQVSHVYCIMKFVSEGDNRADAEDLFSICTKLMPNLPSVIKYPVSWAFLYGNPAPKILY